MNSKSSESEERIFELVEILLRAAKIPIDLYIFFMYMRLIHYFSLVKRARMKALLMRFGCGKKLLVVYVFVLGVLALYSTIIQLVYLCALYVLEDKSAEE